MAVTLFGGLLDILRISNPLASNPSYHKVEWIRSTGDESPDSVNHLGTARRFGVEYLCETGSNHIAIVCDSA
jgi:hypothetical protein